MHAFMAIGVNQPDARRPVQRTFGSPGVADAGNRAHRSVRSVRYLAAMNANRDRHVVVDRRIAAVRLALVRVFADRGDVVHATCRATSDRAALDQVALSGAGRVHVYCANTTSSEDLAALAVEVGERTNHLDVVVNNAGVMTDGDTIRTLDSAALLREL